MPRTARPPRRPEYCSADVQRAERRVEKINLTRGHHRRRHDTRREHEAQKQEKLKKDKGKLEILEAECLAATKALEEFVLCSESRRSGSHI